MSKRGISSPPARRPVGSLRSTVSLQVECLEDRRVPSCNVISGYVFHDANNNGLFDLGESPIAGSAIELHNANNVVVAHAVTDSQGYYEFRIDETVDTSPTTHTVSLSFPESKTNGSQTLMAAQFDARRGELQAVEIQVRGWITSEIKVENFDPSPTSVQGTVSGKLTIVGPHVHSVVTTASDTQTFAAAAFDGVADFGGTSGVSFAPKTVAGQSTIWITDPAQLATYVGTGTLAFTQSAQSTSSATGGGNLAALIGSVGGAQLEVIYHYVPSNCLTPGDYVIVQTSQPAGYFDGLDAREGVILPGSVGSDRIPVTLANRDLTNNTFAEIAPAEIAGFVYRDANNDGVKQSGEKGIAGVVVKLNGVNDLGETVSLNTATESDGSYRFSALRPGVYSVVEIQPAGLLDGKETVGTAGGVAGDDVFTGIPLSPGVAAAGYNFGELPPSSLAGTVFQDNDNDGIRDAGEPGLSGVGVQLTGIDDRGQQVNQLATTDGNGGYRFANLRPGTYTLTQLPPGPAAGGVGITGSALLGLLDGKDSAGSAGGVEENDRISSIVLPPGTDGVNYNFAEILPASISGVVYVDLNNNGLLDPGEPGIAATTVGLLGVDDQGNFVESETTTDAAGRYDFANLRPGTYEIAQKQPAGYLDGGEQAGSAGGTVSDDLIADVTLRAGQSAAGYHFGELPPASISGGVGIDDNNNGLWDAGEPRLPGVTIQLTGVDDRGQSVALSTTTDAAGAFRFDMLRPGRYTLSEIQPPGFLDGKDSAGSLGGIVTNDRIDNIVLPQGQSAVDYYFGELQAASLGGYVYVDGNNNGVREPGETGIAGVAITLVGTDDLGGEVLRSTLTAADGSYFFAGLRPGIYMLIQTQPAGYDDGIDSVGSLGGIAENDRIRNIVLTPGSSGVNYNFGERPRMIVQPQDVPLTLSKFDFLGSTARRRLR